jgi:hypothetical protein
MKSLIFKNGESLEFLEMYQTNEYVYDTVRDVLEFHFNPEYSLDKINELFSKENCKSLIIRETYEKFFPVIDAEGNEVLDENGEIAYESKEMYVDSIYNNYNILLSLNKSLYLPIHQTQISIRTAAMTETELRLEELENGTGEVSEEELNNSYIEGVNSL